jgi:glycerol-3-phosphate dehydrogenase
MNPEIHGALFFPSAGVVSPYGLTIAYAENAVDNGVRFSLDTAVLGMRVENGEIKSVQTNRGTVYPKVVVNAAGVFSEDVAKCLRPLFSIHPRRGTNTSLDSKSAVRLNTIVSRLELPARRKSTPKAAGDPHNRRQYPRRPDAVETYEKENFATPKKA